MSWAAFVLPRAVRNLYTFFGHEPDAEPVRNLYTDIGQRRAVLCCGATHQAPKMLKICDERPRKTIMPR